MTELTLKPDATKGYEGDFTVWRDGKYLGYICLHTTAEEPTDFYKVIIDGRQRPRFFSTLEEAKREFCE